jgi:SAM-dependent methyltransferase
VARLAECLRTLCARPAQRGKMGRLGRARVSEFCDIRRNIERLLEIFLAARREFWRASLEACLEHRRRATPEKHDYYERKRQATAEFFRASGRLLDVGCGQGEMRRHLPAEVAYFGCDPVVAPCDFSFAAAMGEALPFATGTFDAVLLRSVLLNVFDVDAVLAESARVLRPGGRLLLHECVNDPNPIHLTHLADTGLRRRVEEHFRVLKFQFNEPRLVLAIAEKPAQEPRRPLVSVAITTYNRERFLARAIESAAEPDLVTAGSGGGR